MALTPRSIQELLDLAAQAYVNLDGDPLRVAEGGDLYTLMRAVAIMASAVTADAFSVQQNANLLTAEDQETILRHVRPFGIDLDPGIAAAGGLTAIAQVGAVPRPLPAGSVFLIGDFTYVATEAVLLSPPWAIVPVIALDPGSGGNQPAGIQATMLNGESFTDYQFVVGTNGLDVLGNPYGDLQGGTDAENLENVKERFFRLFNNPGFALVNVLHATALNIPGVTAASVLRHHPAPGYVTVYVDANGGATASLLEEVETALYEKASAGEYLIVRAMERELVDLEVRVSIDGTVTTNDARIELEQVIKVFLYDLISGEGLYQLKLKEPIAELAYTRTASLYRIEGTETVPFTDIPGRENVRLQPGLIRVVVSSES